MSTSQMKILPSQTILTGDCLDVCRTLANGCLNFIYIDPPYFTRRDFSSQKRGQEPGAETLLHFSDRWSGSGQAVDRQIYLAWLSERIHELHRLLTPNGVFLLHLDWHIVHYAKVLCDDIFGDAGFRNELIWHYQTGGASKGHFSRKHDTILFYAKGLEHYFDGESIAIPRTEKAMKRARSGIGARIAVTDTHKNPEDVLNIPALNPMSNERTGYPTQKPVELLERLITALCPREGIVGDFFCGSGTTLVAAKRLGRRYFGCDVSKAAVTIAQERLQKTETT